METPIQILLVRDRTNAVTSAYESMLRLAFEGTSSPTDSAATYLQDATDLQIRVLDLPQVPRGEPPDQLLNGARRTVAVAIHSDTDSVFEDSKELRTRIIREGGREVLAKLPKPPIDDNKQQSTEPDANEPAFLACHHGASGHGSRTPGAPRPRRRRK